MTSPPPIPETYQTDNVVINAEAEKAATEVAPPSVPQCPPPTHRETPDYMPPMPKTYMVWNLVLCLLCIVTGIIGLVFSSKVTQRYNAGDYDGAVNASKDARLMMLASVVMGLVNVPFLILYIALT